MSAIKGILGFICGLIVCGILMLLMTIKSPIQTEPMVKEAEPAPASTSSQDDATQDNDAEETRQPEVENDQDSSETQSNTESETTQPEENSTTIEDSSALEEPAVEEPSLEEPTVVQPVKPEVDETVIETQIETAKVEDDVTTNTEPEAEVAEVVVETPIVETPVVEAPVVETPEIVEQEVVVTEPEVQVEETETAQIVAPQKANQLKTVGTLGTSNGFKSLAKANKTKTNDGTVALGAFDQNTQNYPDPTGAVLSVILTDVGQDGLTRSDILKTTFPLTVAVNANMRGSALAAADFYDGGFEVLVQNPTTGEPLIEERDAQAVQGRIDEFLAAVPNAVGFVDNPKGVLQKTRPVQQAILDRFENTGHALLSYKRGLDNTKREASKRNLPSGAVFRVLDANGETPETIARYLNRAVLEANQEGSAIVMGKATKETYAAIQSWIDAGNTENITLVPVSAAIRAQK